MTPARQVGGFFFAAFPSSRCHRSHRCHRCCRHRTGCHRDFARPMRPVLPAGQFRRHHAVKVSRGPRPMIRSSRGLMDSTRRGIPMPRPATTPASCRPACRNAAQAVVAVRPVTMARLAAGLELLADLVCDEVQNELFDAAILARFSGGRRRVRSRAVPSGAMSDASDASGGRKMSQSGSFSVRRLFARPGLRCGYCRLLPRCEGGLHQPSNRFTPRWDIPLLPTPIVEPAQKFLRHAHFHPLGRTVGIILQRLFQRSLHGVGLH